MNWPLIRKIVRVISQLGYPAGLFAAGSNLAAMNVDGTAAGPGDYLMYVAGPLAGSAAAWLSKGVVDFLEPATATGNGETQTVVNKVEAKIADLIPDLVKAGNTEAVRVLLAATDAMQGRTR